MNYKLQVSLAECLEVRGSPLHETELWAVLVQALERIYEFFNEGIAEELDQVLLPITPDSLMLYPNGQIDYISAHKSSMFYEDCLPPEFLSRVSFDPHQLEKMYIYSLGMSVYCVADYNLTSEQDLNISSRLDELLNLMCSKNPGSRIDLTGAIKACSDITMNITPILELYNMVLGGIERMNLHSVEEKSYDYSYEVFKPTIARSSVESQLPAEANTIHYILLDRGPSIRSSHRSRGIPESQNDQTWGSGGGFYPSYNEEDHMMTGSNDKITYSNDIGDIVVEETYSRLNDRRKKLESLRKGLQKLDDDILENTSRSNLTTMSHSRLLKSTPNLTNFGDEQQPLSFFSSEYEWLDDKAKQIDEWRRAHIKMKEVIITPDPVIREASMYSSQPNLGVVMKKIAWTDSELDVTRPDVSLESLVLPRETTRTDYNTFEQNRQVKFEPHLPKKDEIIQVSEEIQTLTVDGDIKTLQNMGQYGPEFRRTYPVADLIVREASLISESNLRYAKVILLNGAEVNIACCSNNTGQQLFDCLAAYLLLREQEYFGMAVLRHDELYFLKRHSKLKKVAPLDWSDRKKFRSRQTSVLILYFCVQYFAPTIRFFSYRSTLHLFYLQLRQHLISGRLQIKDLQTNFKMAGLALQAEYGTNNEDIVDKNSNKNYLPWKIIQTVGQDVCFRSMLSKYRQFAHLPEGEAEEKFVEECMKLQEYSLHFYIISKSNTAYGNLAWTGIGLKGIAIGRELEETRVLEAFHHWGDTLKLSYNRHRFSISYNMVKNNYFTDSHKKCHYLLWLSTNQHSFNMNSRLPIGRDNFHLIDDTSVVEQLWNIDEIDREAGVTYKMPKSQQIASDIQPKTVPSRDMASSRPLNRSFPYEQPNEFNRQPRSLQFNESNKFVNYLKTEPQIELPRFNFEDTEMDSTNDSVTPPLQSLPPSIPPLQSLPPSIPPLQSLPPSIPDNSSVLFQKSGDNLPPTSKPILRNPVVTFPSNIVQNNNNPQLSQNVPRIPIITTSGPTDDLRHDAAPHPFSTNRTKVPPETRKPPVKAPRSSKDASIKNYEKFPVQPNKESAKQVTLPKFNFVTGEEGNRSLSQTSENKESKKNFEPENKMVPLPQERAVDVGNLVPGPPQTQSSRKSIDTLNTNDVNSRSDIYPATNPTLENPTMDSAPVRERTNPETSETTKRINITLARHPPSGYGIGLARDREHEGVFVISLLPGGVADLDGRLKPGDEIKVVNGVGVSGSEGYAKALKLLSQNIVNLEVERKSNFPQTPKDRGTSLDKVPVPDIKTDVMLADDGLDSKSGNHENVGSRGSGFDNVSYTRYAPFDASDSPEPMSPSQSNSLDTSKKLDASSGNNTIQSNYNRNNNIDEFITSSYRLATGSNVSTANSTMESEISTLNEARLASLSTHSDHTFFNEGSSLNNLSSYNSLEDSAADAGDEEESVDVLKLLPPENDVVFVSEGPILYSIDRLKEFPKVPKKITDSWLLFELQAQLYKLNFVNYKGIKLEKVIEKIETQISHDQPLIEFRSMTHPRGNYMCTEGLKVENKLKNRYQNVLPFDGSRVMLLPQLPAPSGETFAGHNNYINASHVKYQAGDEQLNFIATQGPLLNTVADFWVMIWQQNVIFIAMLTKEFENGQNKCCRYLPDHKLIIKNKFEIILMEIQKLDNFDIKYFSITEISTGNSRLICQSSFQNWPDHSTPDSLSIIKFLSLMEKVDTAGPVVIHCSAGIGRTGVLMVMKICLELIKQDMKFDVKTIVENLREQRAGVIQTKQQYLLCYQVILQLLKILD